MKDEQALTVAPERLPAPAQRAINADMILRAAQDPSVDVAKMEALLGLAERVLANESREAYNAAMNACQAEMPRVAKDGRVVNHKTGAIQSRYATLEAIDRVVRPIYQQHGFSISYGTCGTDGGKYVITAIVRHIAGHSEEYRMPLALDQSGAKNDTQGMGSTMSYGRRYLLCSIFNIITEGEDNDGRGSVETINEQQAQQLRTRLDATDSDKAKFCSVFGIARLEELPLARLPEASALIAKKERR